MNNLIVLASLTTFLSFLTGISWESVDKLVAEKFPTVKSITTEKLQQRLRNPTVAPVVIDVRATEEFAVSYLPTAINLTTVAEIAAQFPDLNEEIILYCSVGYRSAAIAEQMTGMGYTKVRNLHHSLFEWANNGYPMVNSEGGTTYAHPYNRRWGRLLRSELHRRSIEAR